MDKIECKCEDKNTDYHLTVCCKENTRDNSMRQILKDWDDGKGYICTAEKDENGKRACDRKDEE